jgi:type IV pilus assembly protein PilX
VTAFNDLDQSPKTAMTFTNHPGRAPARERGVALIVGLVILAVLSLIGVAAFTMTTQEERMAGNSRDRMLAFEAAEAALRSCEDFVAANGGTAAFNATPANPGMYVGPSTSSNTSGTPIAEQHPTESWWQVAPGGTSTALHLATFGGGVSFQPSCVAEWITLYPYSGYTVSAAQSNPANIAHITAHGYGLNSNTVVRLESFYSM